MILELIPPRAVGEVWGDLGRTIAPALRRERRSSWSVLDGIMDGTLEAWRISGDGDGFAVTSVGYVGHTDIKACWIVFVGGSIAGGPKRRTEAAVGLLRQFEDLARKCGCAEMRLETRAAWRHALHDYDVIGQSGPYTFFRKALQ